jgi:hypothetical protein
MIPCENSPLLDDTVRDVDQIYIQMQLNGITADCTTRSLAKPAARYNSLPSDVAT